MLSPPANETPGPRLTEQKLRPVPSAAEIVQASLGQKVTKPAKKIRKVFDRSENKR